MDFNQYQKQARATAIYSKAIPDPVQDLAYTVLGLCSEAGECASVLKKFLRDGEPAMHMRAKMQAELGDVLWYTAMLADELGFSLDLIAIANLAKLKDRQERDKLSGSGNTR